MKKSVALLKGFVCAFLLTGLFVTDSALVSAAETESAHEQELKVEYPTGGLSEAWKDSKVEPFKVSKEEFKKLPGTRLNRVSLNSYRTDDYYYDMLNEDDKLVYDAFLKASRMNLEPVASGEEVNLETQAVLVYKGNRKLNVNWKSIYPAIEFDHPEELESIVFYTRLPYTWRDNEDGTTTYAYYLYFGKASDYSGTQIGQMEAELKSACNSFYNGLSLSGSDFDKELAIHDALIEAVEYNHPVADNNRSHDVAHTAYGALVNKSPVCDGYSKAFKMLLNKAGIECHVVAGLGGGGHAWNIVNIGGEYYEVDATWDDQTSADESEYKVLLLHDYFNRTTDDFKNHKFDVPGWVANTTSHIRDPKYMGYLTPAIANGTEYSYNNVKKVYNLTFDGVIDNAHVVLRSRRTCTYEGKIIEMPFSVWANGYEFDGWYTSKTGGMMVDENTVLHGDTTLYAHWTGDKVTVTLYTGSSATTTTKEVTFGEKYGELPQNITKTGYTFAGWYTDSTFTTKVTADTLVANYYDHYLHAKWVAGEFTITFDANGGTVKVGSVKKSAGELCSGFETPTRYGYTFAGWYDAREGGERLSTIYPVAEDRTLHAHWTPIQSKVIFHINYRNDTSSSTQKVNYGETYAVAFYCLGNPTRPGNNLIGWFTEPEGGTQITANSVVDHIENLDLYAHWDPITVRVYFHADGSDRELQCVDMKYGQTYGDAFDALPYVPAKAHASLDGWSTSSDSRLKANRSGGLSASGEMHFYALFVDNKFNLELNANGGQYTNADTSKNYQATYGTELSLSQYATPFRNGYVFKGWGVGTGETETIDSVTLTQDTTLYAVWEKKTYTLRLEGIGGKFADGSQTKSYAVGYNDDVCLSQYEHPVKAGCTFMGWGTSATASDTIDTFTMTGSRTFYALWQKNSYTVTVSANGGQFSDGSQTKETVAAYNEYVSLSQYGNPVRDGYKFKGWSTSLTGESKVYTLTVTGTVTVYATWEMNSYTLRLSGNGGKFADGSLTKSYTVGYNDEVILGQYESPVRDGYIFKGWNTSTSGTSAMSSVKVSINTYVYAVWEKVTASSGDNNQSGNTQSGNTQSGNTQGDNTQGNAGNQSTQGGNNQTGNTQGGNNQGNTGNQPAQDDNNQSGNDQPAAVTPQQPASETTPSGAPVDAIITEAGNDLQLSSRGNASVIDNGDMNVSSVNIGDTVTYEGISYNITEIKDNAYKNRKKLKSFSVGANIEKIGSNAFSGCKSLKKITIKANNLKTVGKGSFKGIKNGAKITVICKDKKTFNKVTKMLKKAGAKKAKFKFKKG